MASLVETCKLNGIDPQRYFTVIGPHGVVRDGCWCRVGADANGRGDTGGRAAKAGTNTSGAGGLKPSEACGRTPL